MSAFSLADLTVLAADPLVWASLATLIAMEVVLGIDNLIFISIVTNRLPVERRERARRVGIGLALILRLLLLSTVAFIVTLTAPLFSVLGHGFSWRDLILIVSFGAVIGQILVLDMVFSVDSIITAVGMTPHVPVMVVAVVVAVGVMLFAATPLANFINANPTVVMLALGFLIMIGMTLIAEGCGAHVSKGYVYAAMAFAAAIEGLNMMSRRAQRRRAGR